MSFFNATSAQNNIILRLNMCVCVNKCVMFGCGIKENHIYMCISTLSHIKFPMPTQLSGAKILSRDRFA